MIIYYEPEGFQTPSAQEIDKILIELEANPFEERIKTSSEILVHRAYEMYTERSIREFIVVSGNQSYIPDPDRVMRHWPPGCPPEVQILEKLGA